MAGQLSKVVGIVNGYKVMLKNTYKVLLNRREFNEMCRHLGTAIHALGNYAPVDQHPDDLRKSYDPLYKLLARYCSPYANREFMPELMTGLRITTMNLAQGTFSLSFDYAAEGIQQVQYVFNFENELSPYTEKYLSIHERHINDGKMRMAFERL